MDPPVFTCYAANTAGAPDKKSKKVITFSRCHSTKLIYDRYAMKMSAYQFVKMVLCRVIKMVKIKHDCVIINIRDTTNGNGEWSELVKSPNLAIGELFNGESFDMLAEKNEDWLEDLTPGAMCDALVEGTW